MTFNIQNELIRITCHKCSEQFQARFAGQNSESEVSCPKCGTIYRYRPEQIAADNKAISNILNEFTDSITSALKKK